MEILSLELFLPYEEKQTIEGGGGGGGRIGKGVKKNWRRKKRKTTEI